MSEPFIPTEPGPNDVIVTESALTTFRPFNDRVLLRRVSLDTSSSKMFLTPTSAQDKAQVCEVIAIGPGAWDDGTGKRLPMAARVGSKVYIGKYSGSEVILPELGPDYLIVREDEILGEL